MKLLVQLLLLAAFTVTSGGYGRLSAQAPATAPFPASEAQAFLGAWALTIDVDGQMLELDLMLDDVDGALVGEMTGDHAYSRITRFSRNAENLVMRFTAEMNGESLQVVVTMTPRTEGADLRVELEDGSFSTWGRAVRK